jgi:RNA polymerase sigma-70 factor (ECF subfamily)
VNDEGTLIRRAQAGDQAAFGQLVQVYQRPVYNLAYRMLGTTAGAEEAAQEAFLRAYRYLHTYHSEKKFSSWLLSIASHYCIDSLRRQRTPPVALDEAPVAALAGPAEQMPEAATLERERQQEVQTLLARLPDSYRLALVLRYWHDLSYEEMARVLGISEQAVKSRLHRARAMMAGHLPTRGGAGLGQATSLSGY